MKVGDVYFNPKIQKCLAITFIEEVYCCWVTNEGKVCADKISWVEKSSEFLANFPTWQEAVNSGEFNN